MNRETNASDHNERSEPEPASSPTARLSGKGTPCDPQARAAARQNNQDVPRQQFIEELKRDLEKTRLPADVKKQILAELPPPQEQERLFREIQEKGGMSFDQFMESLGLEVHPQP
jgi:hypothetical protein